MVAMTKRKPPQQQVTEHHYSPWRFVPPWICAALLPGAGYLLHKLWGGQLPGASVAAIAVFSGCCVISAMTFLYARQARPKNPLLQYHAVASCGWFSGSVLVTQIIGWHRPWADIYYGVSAVVLLTWAVRQLAVFRHDEINGPGGYQQGGVMAELGVDVKKAVAVVNTPERFETRVKLGSNQTADDVTKVIGNIASSAGDVLRGTMRAIPGKFYNDVLISGSRVDTLSRNLPWPGPSKLGGSIADGICLGLYEDGRPIMVYPAGDYKKNIAPGHTAIGGMPRSGKGATAEVMIGEIGTRIDVITCLSDNSKGDQFLNPVRPAVYWYKDTDNGIRAQLHAYQRAMVARNKAIGAAGYKAWTPACYTDKKTPSGQPGLRMPAVICHLEESAGYLDDNARLITKLGNQMLSSGMFLVLSQQRWSHDQAPTSLRAAIANVLCFGTADDQSAGFLVSEETIKGGIDPHNWKTKFPGRMLVEGNGIDEERFSMPGKGFYDPDGENRIYKALTEFKDRAEADPITLAAFGKAFERGTADKQDDDSGDVVQQLFPPPPSPAEPVDPADTEEEDEDEMTDEDDDPTEYTVPKYEGEDAAEMQLLTDGMDGRQPLQEFPGDAEVDMTPEPDGRPELSIVERRAKFDEVLADFIDAGKTQVHISEIHTAWEAKIGPVQSNQGPYLYQRIRNKINDGWMQRLPKGNYLLVTAVTAGEGFGDRLGPTA